MELQIVAPRRSVAKHLTDIWKYRQLLRQLIRRELTVRYQKSVLGLAWSLANPLLLLIIYTIVFKLLDASFESFGIWILSGLLLWNFFGSALATATQAITGNAYLIGKVNFPREILPLASVGATFVHFLLSGGLLLTILSVTRFHVDWAYLWLSVPAIITCVVLVCALAILLSAANVYVRDTTHLLDLALLTGFWLTPIIYPFQLVTGKLEANGLYGYLHLLNPMTPLVTAMQRGIYGSSDGLKPSKIKGAAPVVTKLLPDLSSMWYLRNIAVVFIFAICLLIVAIKAFDRAEANFAEVM
jgi:ABC-2 type transport system permease protein